MKKCVIMWKLQFSSKTWLCFLDLSQMSAPFLKPKPATKQHFICIFPYFWQLHISSCIIKLALAVRNIADTDRPQSSWPALILFWAPIQVLESRNGSGEQQNLGQGLPVFKCTIGALTQGQGEFTKMACRLLKHLKKGKIQLISMNRAISVLARLQVHTNKTSKGWHDSMSVEPQNIMWFKYFGKSENTDCCTVLCRWKMTCILVADFSAAFSHGHFLCRFLLHVLLSLPLNF